MNTRYSNNKKLRNINNNEKIETDEIESLSNNIISYFLTSFQPPSLSSTKKKTFHDDHNDKNKPIRKFIYQEKFKNSNNQYNKNDGFNTGANTTSYEQQHNNFKQIFINIEKSKNIVYKENIRMLLNENKDFQKQNKKLQKKLNKAKSSIQKYQNENKIYEKRISFYHQMLSLGKIRNNYNDLHHKIKGLDNRDDNTNTMNASQNNNDLSLEIMEINLHNADIACELACYSVEYHCATATKTITSAPNDDSNIINNNEIVSMVNSKEIAQKEHIKIDVEKTHFSVIVEKIKQYFFVIICLSIIIFILFSRTDCEWNGSGTLKKITSLAHAINMQQDNNNTTKQELRPLITTAASTVDKKKKDLKSIT